MSFLDNLKRKALNDGKLFKTYPQSGSKRDINGRIIELPSNCKLNLPTEQYGFIRTFERKWPLKCVVDLDCRSVVSLALINRQSEILQCYANKLPIMVINTARLLYTTEAFALQLQRVGGGEASVSQRALEFYIETDLKHCSTFSTYNANSNNIDDFNNDSQPYPPNEKFSNFIHRLRSNGYMDYIFELARRLNLNVDYVVDRNIVCRYKRVETSNTNVSLGSGYLTVVQNENRWYVKTTTAPICTNE